MTEKHKGFCRGCNKDEEKNATRWHTECEDLILLPKSLFREYVGEKTERQTDIVLRYDKSGM